MALIEPIDKYETKWELINHERKIMANGIVVSKTEATEKIIDLSNWIKDGIEVTLGFVMQIGELLVQQKKALKHGEFGKWIDEELPFKRRTAQQYMKLFNNRDKLNAHGVALLGDAYKLLAEPKKPDNESDTQQHGTDYDSKTDEALKYVKALLPVTINGLCDRIQSDEKYAYTVTKDAMTVKLTTDKDVIAHALSFVDQFGDSATEGLIAVAIARALIRRAIYKDSLD